jgi:tartrate-resistant acid phosphatase type 5
MNTRRLVVSLALCAIPVVARAQSSFLVIGDWGRDGAGYQTSVAKQMAAAAARLHAAFVVSVGDNFYEEGVQKASDNQFKTSFEDIYKAPSLQIPWYVAIGNHDYHGNVQAEIDYSKVDPRWHMPARYFTVHQTVDSTTSVDLFFLDTSPFVTEYRTEDKYKAHVAGIDTKAQVHWLDSALAASTAQWKIVIGHHPLYSSSPKHGNTPELIANIKPLLEKYHAQVYLCGHDHNLQHSRVGRVDYFVSGGGSEARPAGHAPYTKFSATSPGFLAVELGPTWLHAQFINQRGTVLDSSAVPLVRATATR